MENVSLDFLSGMNGIVTGMSDSTGMPDLSSTGGLSFTDMLKAATSVNSDIPSAKEIAEAVSKDIPDTKDIVAFNSVFSQLYTKLSESDQSILSVFKDYLNSIVEMLNESMMDCTAATTSAVLDVSEFCSNTSITLDPQTLSALLHSDTPQIELDLSDSLELNVDDVNELISDFNDVIVSGLESEDVSIPELLNKLSVIVQKVSSSVDTDVDIADTDYNYTYTYAVSDTDIDDDTDVDESDDDSEINIKLNISDNSDNAMSAMIASLVDTMASCDGYTNSDVKVTTDKIEGVLKGISNAVSNEMQVEYPDDKLMFGFTDQNNNNIFTEVKFLDYKPSDNDAEGVYYSNNLSSSNLKIADVSDQVDALNAPEPKKPTEELHEFIQANMEAMQGVDPENIPVPDVKDVAKLAGVEIDSIESQVTEQISSKILSGVKEDGVSEMTIILKPEKLGEIAVKIVSNKGAVEVMLSAQNQAVGNAINERLSSLAVNLTNQNIDVKNIVVINPTDAGTQMGLDFTNQGFNRKEDSQSSDSNGTFGKTDSIDAIDDLESENEYYIESEANLWATRA